MQGCSIYTQLSKNPCGGCAFYVNSQLDHLVRNDLSALEEEYETWVEINNHKAKNFFPVVYTGILQVMFSSS